MNNVITVAAPSGEGGRGGTGLAMDEDTDHNTKVHIHRGVLGDLVDTGGPSDLNSAVHPFNNPVAKVVLTVK